MLNFCSGSRLCAGERSTMDPENSMSHASRSAALMGMLIVTAGVIYIEISQGPPEWSRAVERIAFLWLGALAVVMPGVAEGFKGIRRRRHRRHRRHEREEPD